MNRQLIPHNQQPAPMRDMIAGGVIGPDGHVAQSVLRETNVSAGTETPRFVWLSGRDPNVTTDGNVLVCEDPYADAVGINTDPTTVQAVGDILRAYTPPNDPQPFLYCAD